MSRAVTISCVSHDHISPLLLFKAMLGMGQYPVAIEVLHDAAVDNAL